MKSKRSLYKRIFSFALCFLFAISILQMAVFASSAHSNVDNSQEKATGEKNEQHSPITVVEQLVAAMDSQDYNTLVDLWTKQEGDTLRQFLFDNADAKAKAEGLHNIKNAKLTGIKQLPIEIGDRYGVDATDYINEYGDACLFYIAVDLKVRNESKYFMNGINYLLVLLVPEDNQWRVALMPDALVDEINQDGLGFGDEAEKKAIEREKHLDKTGEVINEDGTVIEDLSASTKQI